MYTFNFTLEGEDAVKAEIVNELATATSSFDCYEKLIRGTLRAAGTDDDKYAFIAKELSYLRIDNVEKNRLIKFSLTNQGAATLEAESKARDVTFEPIIETNKLLVKLVETINSILEKVRAEIIRHTTDAETLPAPRFDDARKLKFYVFYDLDDYKTAMGSAKNPWTIVDDARYAYTYYNSLDTPLLRVNVDGLDFFNCDDYLYLTDLTTPPTLFFFDESPIRQVSLDRTATKTQPETIKSNWENELSREPGVNETRKFSFNFRRTYVPLYLCDSNQIKTHLLWWKTSGMGQGIGRADAVDEKTYLWSFCGDLAAFKTRWGQVLFENGLFLDLSRFNEAHLGQFLGLSPERMISIDYVDRHEKIIEGKNQFKYRFVTRRVFTTGKIGGSSASDVTKFYVLCNTPYVSQNLPHLPLQFLYFRQVGQVGDGTIDPSRAKVLKNIQDKRNRPLATDLPQELRGPEYVGLNLPVSMQIPKNRELFNSQKKEWGVIKNKGNYLTTNPHFRKDAGKVMGVITAFSDHLTEATTLSAGTLAYKIISRKKDAADDWHKLKLTNLDRFPTDQEKLTNLDRFPTDQEWCHLHGHGDGGDERPGNFVSGSTHCNTEQLAIESAQRPTTHAAENTYVLKSTAYLIKDDSMKLLEASAPTGVSGDPASMDVVATEADNLKKLRSTYLGVDRSYLIEKYEEKAKLPDKVFRKRVDIDQTGCNAPLAKFIRYKIYRRPGDQVGAPELLFDYVFEGQSEFFDRNQYNILTKTVRFLLDHEGFFKDLADYYEREVLKPKG